MPESTENQEWRAVHAKTIEAFQQLNAVMEQIQGAALQVMQEANKAMGQIAEDVAAATEELRATMRGANRHEDGES